MRQGQALLLHVGIVGAGLAPAHLQQTAIMSITMIQHRARRVGLVKFIVAALFGIIVLLNLRHPATIFVTVLDLVLVPIFVWLAPRHPQLAAYGMVVSTALLLTPRQFAQGYVNGINWPIYIVAPLIGGYILMTRRALFISAILTAVIAVPMMLLAAFTLPPRITQAEVFTLIVFVVGLGVGLVVIVGDLLAHPPRE